jgi:PAS domain S-box-containing protein
MTKENPSKATKLRQKAEEQLNMKSSKKTSPLSEADILRLNHELQVHQIELVIQNEELKLAKEEAENNAQKYTELYDFAPMGYFTFSTEGEIIGLNFGGAKMLGKERSNLLGNRFGFFVSEDTKPIFNNFLNKVFTSNIKESCELSLSIRGNSEMYVQLAGTNSENGKQCFATMLDITERKLADQALKESEKKLVQLNADKDRFISILGHDLRNPFNGLLGLSNLLNENIQDFNIEQIKKMGGLINKTAHSTFNLLEDILLWARTQQGKVPFMQQNLSFRDLCNVIQETLITTAIAKNITIHYSFTDKLSVFADGEMLKTVLRNLITNAIKFTNSGGTINISAVQTPSTTTISVSDNGVGISPDDLAKLFAFGQIQTTKGTADEKGTGLGLLLCKEFVEKHGGRIWVESTEGKGSTFSFSIPAKKQSNIEEEVRHSLDLH